MSDSNNRSIERGGSPDEANDPIPVSGYILDSVQQRLVDELIENGWQFSGLMESGRDLAAGGVQRARSDAADDVLAALAAFVRDCDGNGGSTNGNEVTRRLGSATGSDDLLIRRVMLRIAGLGQVPSGGREVGGTESAAAWGKRVTNVAASGRDGEQHDDVLTDAADDALFLLSNNGYNASAVPGAIAAEARTLMATLQLLDLQTPGEYAAIAGGAETLFARTLAGVQAEIDASAGRMMLDAEPTRFGGGLRGVRVADVGGALAAAVVLLGVSVPVITAMREKSRIAYCGNNLKQVGVAMGQYATDWQRKMPTATAGLGGGVWWNVGKAGQSNSENMFVLSRERYASVQSMGCAGSNGCMASMGPSTRDYTCHKDVSYSMQLPRCGEKLTLDGPRRTVVADRNPVTSRALRGEMMDVLENSPNHGGRGQQLLDNGGAVTWTSEPRDFAGGDLLWIPRQMELQISATGRRWMKPLQGMEMPDKNDVMLGP